MGQVWEDKEAHTDDIKWLLGVYEYEQINNPVMIFLYDLAL